MGGKKSILGFICLISSPGQLLASLLAQSGKESACNAGDLGSNPGTGRSPGEGNGNPLQYSCLESPMARGVWRATVHGVTRVGHDLATKLPPPGQLLLPLQTSFWPLGRNF